MSSPHSLSASSIAARRACNELSRRLRLGLECRAEDLLAAEPAISTDTDDVLELLYTEFVVREELGQQPQPADWLVRFPQWRRELLQIFEVHELVESGNTQGQAGRETHVDQESLNGGRGTGNLPAISGYEVLREVGRGGMGIVYQARQLSLGRVVALKTILPPHGERERARFRAEAEATARLSHPHIVPVFEVGQDGETPYLSMEFVAGESLDQALVKAVFAPRAAAELLQTLARAVSYAHSQGIVHRDLKPANVLLPAGEGKAVAKLTDFGLAKSLDGLNAGANTVAIVGTPSYMAPEQCTAGGVVGPTVDVYSLGAILYEALTGRPPFRGPTAIEILEMVRAQEPVPPSQLAAHIPRDLETICLKCLAKTPEQRYASAALLAEDLRRFLADEPIVARPVSRAERGLRWCRRNPLVAALVGGIAVALVSASVISTTLAIWAQREKSRANRYANQELAARQLAEERFAQAEAAVGKYLDGIENDPRLKEADFHELRSDLLSSAVSFYEEFVATRPGEPALEAKRGRAYGRLGLIRRQVGQLDEAAAHYEQMREIFQKLGTGDGDFRADLASCHYQLGHVLFDRGQMPEAEVEYQKSLDFYQTLAREFPQEHAHQHRVANCYRSLGMLRSKINRPDEAEIGLRQALLLMEQLAQTHSEELPYQEAVAALHSSLANVLTLEESEEKERHYRLSVELYEQLAKENPRRPDHRFGLAMTRNNLGALHEARRQNEAALHELEAALASWKEIVAEFPSVPTYQRFLAVAHLNLGQSLRQARRPNDAEKEVDAGIAILKPLTVQYEESPENRRMLAYGWGVRADVLNALGRPVEAERELRAALQLWQALAEQFPEVPADLATVARCHTVLGEKLAQTKRVAEAEREFAAAVGAREKLAARNSTDEENLRLLAVGLDDWGTILQRLERRADAQAKYHQALQLWEERLLPVIRLPAHHAEAAKGIANLAAVVNKAGDVDEACRLYDLAAKQQGQALRLSPHEVAYANTLWRYCFEVASVQRQRKDHAAVAAAAKRLAAIRPAAGEDAVWAARFFGRCMELAETDSAIEANERRQLVETYGDQAMEYLHEAVRRGFRDTAGLKKLIALAPLLKRADFQELVRRPQAP